MKRFFGKCAVVLAAAMLLASGEAFAKAYKPQAGNTGAGWFEDPSLIGLVVGRVETSTPLATAVVIYSGSGLLYQIDASSGTSGKYCIAFDSATVTGLARDVQGLAISPQVETVQAATNCTSQAHCGSWRPVWPARFENGLSAIKDSTDVNCLYYYRPDKGANPGP